jgi:glycosyltransferase involved in cell wall biosynthesis/SAM-dependent methyltransferase
LVFDDLYGEVDPAPEPFDLVRLEDLGEEMTELHRMAALYDVMEFATSVKPWLLETLLDAGSAEIIYLDPDIQVFDRLDDLAAGAREHGIVLTPHVTAPLPRDGCKTDETSILAAGIYNMGFIAVGQGSRPFLQFWKKRLLRECRLDPVNMRFVDQRWVDFVPGMYDHAILRDPTINVAYWNLHHRSLDWDGKRYTVDGSPLRFFHFSGYTPKARHLLSKHQGDRPRILLSEHPALARLCDEYGDLLEQCGYAVDDDGAVDYGFSRMANGVAFDELVRTLYRKRVERADASHTPLPPDPFDATGARELVAWLNRAAPADAGPERLSLYQATLYAYRPELHAQFPDPQGADFDAFQHWVHDEVRAGRIDPLLAPSPPLEAPDRDMAGSPTSASEVSSTPRGPEGWAPAGSGLVPGINVAGYFRAELGIGESGRLTMAAIEAAGIPFTTVAYAKTNSRQQHPFTAGAGRRDFDTNVIVVNADQLRHFADEVGPEFFAGRYTIGQWAWELEEFPKTSLEAFDIVDEVWTISEFTRASVAAATDKPVFAFPLPIIEPTVPFGIDRERLGLPEGFLFLFCFDLFSALERKNPVGLVEAFRRAFRPNEGPVLVIKAINGSSCVEDLERLRWAARGRRDILVLDRYFDAQDNTALMALADCYVSLHRSEGFGLTMSEAMSLGKPVIATGYSGNMDFMNADNAYLVPWTKATVPAGAGPYRQGAHWADPDLDAAASLMRHVVDHPDEAMEVGRRARESVLRDHTLAQRALFVRERFEAIHERRPSAPPSTAATIPTTQGPPAATTPRLVDLASSPRDTDGPTRFGRVGRLYRRLEHRALRRRDEQQRHIDTALANAVERLEDDSAALQEQLSRATGRLHDSLRSQSGRLHSIDVELRRLRARLDTEPSFEYLQQELQRLHAIPYMGDPLSFATTDGDGRPAIGYRTLESKATGTYADFEDVFRGPEDLIRDLLRPYLPLLADASPVLDVGCGRGEMLDLLSEAGIEAAGVDLDASMVRRCRHKGHRVEQADAVAYLQAQVDESWGAVFAAQVVEHLHYDDLLELLTQSRRVLRPGGMVVLETVNPHALHAFKTFWVDLTHRVPIYPEVLVAHCRNTGFDESLVMFPGATGDLDHDRWTSGAYAVIARKKPS